MKNFGLGVVLLTLFGIGMVGPSQVNAQTQLEMNKEACDHYKQADADLNQTYQTVLREHAGDRIFLAALRKAQLAWVRFRDAHLESLYPGVASQYGSVNPMCRCNQLETLTKERTKVLRQWVEGIEEGDVCAGSVKSKDE
jgi:uncharacterized protein YecT (DUF1311 family)